MSLISNFMYQLRKISLKNILQGEKIFYRVKKYRENVCLKKHTVTVEDKYEQGNNKIIS